MEFDRISANEVYELLHKQKHVWVIEDEYTAAELKAMIGQLDMFIGERTHSVIAAMGMHIPSIAISYPEDFRTYGIIGKMLKQKKWLYDVRYLNAESLCKLIDDCWKSRKMIRENLQLELPPILERADKTGLLIFNLLKNYHEH